MSRPSDAPRAPLKVEIIVGTLEPADTAAAWLFYPMARARYVQEHPELYDGQSGFVIPTFEEEVAGRFILADGCAHGVKEGKAPASRYFADLLRVHQAGYLREYVWWYLNQPAWPVSQQPPNLLPFMAWARTNLQNHLVETYGALRILPEDAGGGDLPSHASASAEVQPKVEVHPVVGSELRSRVQAADASLHQGNWAEVVRALDGLPEAVRQLQTDPDATYLCVRSQRELTYLLASRPELRKVRLLDWAAAAGLQLCAFVLSHTRRFSEANLYLGETQRLAPLSAQAWTEQGFILNHQRQPSEALAAYQRALELATRLPENASVVGPALRGLGVAWIELGDLGQAGARLRDSLILEPGNPVATQELAYIERLRASPGA